MQAFLDVGFILREDIIKYQWRTKTTREKWGGLTKVAEKCWVDMDKTAKKYYMDFYLLFYEHLFIFRKPEKMKTLATTEKVLNGGKDRRLNPHRIFQYSISKSLSGSLNGTYISVTNLGSGVMLPILVFGRLV